MFESTIEKFIETDILIANNIGYEEAMKETLNVILHGVVKEG